MVQVRSSEISRVMSARASKPTAVSLRLVIHLGSRAATRDFRGVVFPEVSVSATVRRDCGLVPLLSYGLVSSVAGCNMFSATNRPILCPISWPT